MFSSIITIVAVFCAMLMTSVWLTLFVIVSLVIIMFVTNKIGENAAKYFIKQQESLGNLNGYIEEMINGQKVIKVFCYEEHAKKDFDVINDELRKNATSANKFANILMPIMSNLGNLQYVLIAIIGGILAIRGIGGLTLGALAAFCNLAKFHNADQ